MGAARSRAPRDHREGTALDWRRQRGFSSSREDRLSRWVNTAAVHARGGTDGNELLTNMTGAVLLVLLAVLGVTIVRIGQLTWLHLFLGLLLIGPVALKMASTGYRFARYYTRDPAYRRKGPPELLLRLIAPLVVVLTIVVFVSGVLLLLGGPQTRGDYFELHKVSFIVWLVFTVVHVLAHLPSIGRTVGLELGQGSRGGFVAGRASRWIALAGAVVGGAVLAIALIPQFGAWTAHGLPHHHH
jgi:hypothetical protein